MKPFCKRFKNSIVKLTSGILFLLSSASLIGMGFSTWIVGQANISDASVNSSFGGIIDVNNYIKYNKAQIFDFCKHGVVIDEKIVSNGDIIIPFYIDLLNSSDKISNHLPDGTVSIKLKTTYTNGCKDITNLFSQYLKSVALSCNTDNFSTDFNYSALSTSYVESVSHTTEFEIKSGLDNDKLYFNVKYSFSFPTLAEFEENVFKKLNREKLWFNFVAGVEL